jgi:hypothetical protein
MVSWQQIVVARKKKEKKTLSDIVDGFFGMYFILNTICPQTRRGKDF